MPIFILCMIVCLILHGIAFAQKDSENVDLEVLKNSYAVCQSEQNYYDNCFIENEPNTNFTGIKKKNKMWEGIIKINDRVTFIFKDGVRKPLDQCTKVGVWYYCPSGQKQRPLEGGGLDENGEREGRWLIKAQDNIIDAHFKAGRFEGYCISKYGNGDVFEGLYQNNMRNGQGKYTLASGEFYSGNYKDDAPHGYGISKSPAGDLYEGNWKYGKRNGKGRQIFSSGNSYQGEYKSDRFHGFGIYKDTNGITHEGLYFNGKKHGIGKYLWDNGAFLEANWINGMIQGKANYTDENGDKRALWFKDNQRIDK